MAHLYPHFVTDCYTPWPVEVETETSEDPFSGEDHEEDPFGEDTSDPFGADPFG